VDDEIGGLGNLNGILGVGTLKNVEAEGALTIHKVKKNYVFDAVLGDTGEHRACQIHVRLDEAKPQTLMDIGEDQVLEEVRLARAVYADEAKPLDPRGRGNGDDLPGLQIGPKNARKGGGGA
jgi:hypothetical protein